MNSLFSFEEKKHVSREKNDESCACGLLALCDDPGFAFLTGANPKA
jgi:hypothetical protein